MQVARVLMAEQVLAGRHRRRIEFGQRRLQRVVERIAGLLVPEQRILPQHLGVGDRGFQIEAAVGVDGELRVLADLLQHGLDALAVLGDRRAADLHLHDVVAAVEIAAHLAAQRRQVLARDNSSRRRHRRTRADWPRGRGARPAAETAACPRSWPPRPTPPCRWCRPRPSARHGRRAFRWTSSRPRPCPGSRLSPAGIEQRLRIGLPAAAARKRSRISPPCP